MQLSVIIPCRNEATILPILLDSLAAQTLVPDEIIVVDSASTDTTRDVAKAYTKTLSSLKVVSTKTPGLAFARNFGAPHASGDMLFFVDADVQLPSNFLQRAIKTIRARHLQAGGFTQRMPSRKLSLRFGAHVMNGYLRTMQHTPWPIAFSCLFATRTVFDKLSGFDTKIYIMEDYDFMLRARRSSFKVGVANVPFLASDRRYVNASSSLFFRGIYAELYRYTHGLRITKPIFEYEMGGKNQHTTDDRPRPSSRDRDA